MYVFLYFSRQRPLVSVFDTEGKPAGQVGLPSVFKALIRPDVLNFVHTNMAKEQTITLHCLMEGWTPDECGALRYW